MVDGNLAALLDGMPSAQETDQKLAQFQPQSPMVANLLQGMPSLQETDHMLSQFGLNQNAPMTAASIRTQETPLQEQQRLGHEYANARANQILQERQGMLLGNAPITNPILRGLVSSGMNTGQVAALLVHPLGIDASGAILEEQHATELAAQKLRGGKEEGTAHKYIKNITTGFADVLGAGGALKKVGLGSRAYLATLGARTYDSALKQASDAGVEGIGRQTFAAAHAGAEVATETVMWKLGRGVMGRMFPTAVATPQDPTGVASVVKKTIADRLLSIGKTAGEEGIEEGVTQIAQNINEIAHGMKPATWGSVMEGVGEAAAVGAAVGGLIGGGHELQRPAPNAPQAAPANAPVEQAEPPTNPQPAPQEPPHATVPQSQEPVPTPVAQPATEAPPQAPQVTPPKAAPVEQTLPQSREDLGKLFGIEIGEKPASAEGMAEPQGPLEVHPQPVEKPKKLKAETLKELVNKGIFRDQLEARSKVSSEQEAQRLLQTITDQPIPVVTPEQELQAHAERESLWHERRVLRAQVKEARKQTQGTAAKQFASESAALDAAIANRKRNGFKTDTLIEFKNALSQTAKTGNREWLSKVYRHAAAEFHPDRNPGDQSAAQAFQTVTKSYQAAKQQADTIRTIQASQQLQQLRQRLSEIDQRLGLAGLTKEQINERAAQETPQRMNKKRAEIESRIRPADSQPGAPPLAEKPKITGEQPFRLETKPEPPAPKPVDFGNNKSAGKPLFVGANDIAGQGYMFGEGQTLPNPEQERRQAATAKGNKTKASNKEELAIYRVADTEKIPVDRLREAVDAEVAKDSEHWQRLKELVGNKRLSPSERKALQERDETSLKGRSDFDELQERAKRMGMDWSEVYHALANGMPTEPSASNEEYVRNVASKMEKPRGEAYDTDLPENVPGNVEGISFFKPGNESPRPDLLSVMRQIERGADRGTLVSIAELRDKAGLSKPEFDAALIDLAQQGTVSLHKTDAAGQLSPDEVSKLIHNPHGDTKGYGQHAPGTYYSGVSIRQSTSAAKHSNVPPMAPPAAQGPAPSGAPVSAGPSLPVGENAVREALGKLFDVPIFRGRVKKSAHGTYNWHDKVIRLSSGMWANVVVASHEIGHAIDDQYKFFNNLLTPAAADELLQLDYNPKKNDMREGFAEFIRTYLTTDDAPTVAPNVLDHFESLMEKNPELKSRIKQSRAMIDKLLARDPMDVVLSQQINGAPVELLEKHGAWDRLKDNWDDFTVRYMEAMHNSAIRVLNLAAEADRKLGQSVEGFYNLFNRLSGSDYRRAIAALEHGIHTISGTPKKLSKSAKEILETIKPDELEKLSGYVYTQVFLANIARKPGYNPGKTKQELENAIDDVKRDKGQYDRFDKAARELTKYFHALVELQAHEGAKSWEEAKRITDSMPDYYAPVFRVEEFGVDMPKRRFGFGQRPGFLNAKSTPRKLGQGSSDQYMNLYDALVKENADAHRVGVQYAMIAPFLRRVLPSLGGAHGLGHLISETDPKHVMDKVRLGKILDQLAATVDKNGRKVKPIVDKATVQLIKDVADLREGKIGKTALDRLAAQYGTRDETVLKRLTDDVRSLKDAITAWKLDFGSSDKEHIIHVHLDGKEVLVQFKDHNLWKAMRGIRNLGEANIWTTSYAAIAQGVQSKITKPLQAMTVGLNPTAVLRLALLDYPAFLKNSKYTGAIEGFTAPLHNIVRLASAMAYEDLKGKTPQWAKDAIGAVTPQIVAKWAAGEVKAGLILKGVQSEESGTVTSGKLFGHGKLSLESIKERFLPHDPRAKWYNSIPGYAEHARDYMAAMDSGMRLAEVVGYARSKGYIVNKNASFADIEAGKNGWLNPAGIAVDVPPANVLAGMLRNNNEVITNYKPKGYVAAELGKFIPFFTARMAGIQREVSTTAELVGGLARKVQGQDSGVENFGARIARMASLATATALYWWFHHDDDDRSDMDPNISKRFFTFSSGGIPYAKIPKPRGPDGLFINAIEGMLDLAVDQKNPEILKTLGITLQDMSPVSATNPANWPAGAGAIYQAYNNKDWAGRSIDDPRQDEKIATEHQTRPWTLESSKFLSHFFTKYIGLSPAKTEYVLQQMTGSMYGDVVGTSKQIKHRVVDGQPVNLRNLPIIRGEAARGLYQRSTGEFYDAYRAMESTVATQNHDRPAGKKLTDEENQDAEKFRQMNRYKQVMSALKKEATAGHDYDKKLELDSYSVGMADYALGKPERKSFPNPLRKSEADVPEAVKEMREKFLGSLIHSMISDVSIKAVIKGGPEKITGKPATATSPRKPSLGERLEKADVQETWAVQEAARLGYSLPDLTRALILQKARAGQKTQYEPDDPHNPFKKLALAWVKNQTKAD